MTYIVNAWLERDEPQLQVMDKRTGRVLVDLESRRVRELFDTGALCLQDFQGPDTDLQQTVRDLFLVGAAKCIGQNA